GVTAGGAGTIYLQGSNPVYPTVIVDNGGLQGTNTLLSVSANQYDLFVTGGARLILGTQIPLGNLLIGSNSWVSWAAPVGTRTIAVNTNMTIQAGGRIILDGQSASNLGAGLNGGGGGYGGYGGSPSNTVITSGIGGNVYGQVNEAVTSGSAGSLGSPSGGIAP